MFEGGYFAQEKRYQRMKFPDQERNLETIMMNMQNMMKQAQKLKKDMDIAQAELVIKKLLRLNLNLKLLIQKTWILYLI